MAAIDRRRHTMDARIFAVKEIGDQKRPRIDEVGHEPTEKKKGEEEKTRKYKIR